MLDISRGALLRKRDNCHFDKGYGLCIKVEGAELGYGGAKRTLGRLVRAPGLEVRLGLGLGFVLGLGMICRKVVM